MYKREINKLSIRTDIVESRFDEFNYNEIGSDKYEQAEGEVYSIENEISEYIRDADGFEYTQLRKLQKRIQSIKKENDFYDADAALDMMFPNRYDEDFDEDSMSYDSVFGDD